MKNSKCAKIKSFNLGLIQVGVVMGVYLVLSLSPVVAEVYPSGTFSIKPLNMNMSSVAVGLRNNDSRIGTYTRELRGFGPGGIEEGPFERGVDLYKSPFSMGFQESDRNGTGYGVELGYMIGWDSEILIRAGYCHEKGQREVEVGERSLNFDDRNNYGFALGARKYIDVSSSWRPYFGGVLGFTVQGKTIASAKDHNFLIPVVGEDTPIPGKFEFLGRKTLFSFEVHAGTDYVFNETWAISISVAARYGERAGSGSVLIPIGNPPATPPSFGGSVPRVVSYSDNRDKWTFPITLSLKIMI